jgi:hypothetical protein
MPIYTPRGLKIRLSVDYAFGLVARLYPKVDAFRVLKTTESIESLPTLFTFVVGLYCFITQVQPINTAVAVFVAYVVASIINLRGFYVIPGIISLGTLYSYVSGFGILLIALLLVGFLTAGWQSVLGFLVGKTLGWGLNIILEFWDTKRAFRLSGHPFTASEKFFFNAYRLHASRLGVTTNIELSEKELQEENWKPAFQDFLAKWPQVASRFTRE